jgi:uncharacterized membrane protein
MDSHKRTILKTITWRVLAIIITIVGISFFDESWGFAVTVGLIINGIKTILYYIHERIWTTIRWQRKRREESHLRTLVKTISWKIITGIVMGIIMYIYTRDLKVSIVSSFGVNAVKAVFYYLHERLWNHKHLRKHIK